MPFKIPENATPEQKWNLPLLSIAMSFRDVGRPYLPPLRSQANKDVMDAAERMVWALNDSSNHDILRHAIRIAENRTTVGRELGAIFSLAVENHCDRTSTVEPLIASAMEKIERFKVSEIGKKFFHEYLWTACVAHGRVGAKLSEVPLGIRSYLTHVPPESGEYKKEESRGAGEAIADPNSFWGRLC